MKLSEKQRLTIEYLQSNKFKNEEDTQDTLKSIPILVKINKKGLITNTSQEGSSYSGYNSETKKYYEIRERAYLTGFMLKDVAFSLVNNINTYTNKIAFIIRNDKTKEYRELFEKNSKEIPKIAVSISGTSDKKKKIKEFKIDTTIPLVLTNEIFNAEIGNITDKIELIAIIDPKYGRKARNKTGLYNDILRFI